MNLAPAWKKGYTGKGVVVSILDDGIQTNHPDLAQNYVSSTIAICAFTAAIFIYTSLSVGGVLFIFRSRIENCIFHLCDSYLDVGRLAKKKITKKRAILGKIVFLSNLTFTLIT
jgi:subtilisin family serine protease